MSDEIKDKIVVLIPGYNCSKTISEVISKIPPFVTKIIFVNDCSTDNTLEVVSKIFDRRLKVVNHKKNKGYGGAHKTLFKEAKKIDADYYVTLHSDLAHNPDEISLMLEKLKKGHYDFVTGVRILGLWEENCFLGSRSLGALFLGKMPPHIYFANRVLTFMQNFFLDTKIVSFHDAYRIYTKEAIKIIPFEDFLDRYFFDTELLVKATELGLKFSDTPASTNYTPNAGTHVNYVGYTISLLWMSIRYRFTKKLCSSWKKSNRISK